MSLLVALNFLPVETYASNSNVVVLRRAPGDYGTYYIYKNKTYIKNINHKFVGYADKLTPFYTYAKEYRLEYGHKFSLSTSLNYNGYTASISYEYTIGATSIIPANSNKKSKLAFYDDFKLYRESVYLHENGKDRFIKYNYKLERIPGRTNIEVRYAN